MILSSLSKYEAHIGTINRHVGISQPNSKVEYATNVH